MASLNNASSSSQVVWVFGASLESGSPRTRMFVCYLSRNIISSSQTFKFTCITDEVKPLLPHLNPDDALSLQLRVDGGELSSESVIVGHFLDKASKFSINHISIQQDMIDSIFALVALCRATSAKLQDFDQDINIELGASKSSICKEEQALERISSKY